VNDATFLRRGRNGHTKLTKPVKGEQGSTLIAPAFEEILGARFSE
jgi:hypothetical protein